MAFPFIRHFKKYPQPVYSEIKFKHFKFFSVGTQLAVKCKKEQMNTLSCNEGELKMEQIITVIKNGKKTTRLGDDAANCLKKIKLHHQVPIVEAFTKEVIRKIIKQFNKKREHQTWDSWRKR